MEVSKRSSAYAKTPGVYLGKSTRTSRRCFRRGNGHRQLSQFSFYMRRPEHCMKLIHSQIFLLICGRVPSGVVNRSRCLFMEGRETTLRIIKLEHTTVLYRKLVLKQFGISMMMWDEIDLDLLVFQEHKPPSRTRTSERWGAVVKLNLLVSDRMSLNFVNPKHAACSSLSGRILSMSSSVKSAWLLSLEKSAGVCFVERSHVFRWWKVLYPIATCRIKIGQVLLNRSK